MCSSYTQLGVLVSVNTTGPLNLTSADPDSEDEQRRSVPSSQVSAVGITCNATYQRAMSIMTVMASDKSVINIAPTLPATVSQMNESTFDSYSFESGLYGSSLYTIASFHT